MQEADETRVNDGYVHLGWEWRADDVTPPNPYCRENAADVIPLLDAAFMREADKVVGEITCGPSPPSLRL